MPASCNHGNLLRLDSPTHPFAVSPCTGYLQLRRLEGQRRQRDVAVARRDARKALRRAARVKDGHVAFPASDNGLPLLRDTHNQYHHHSHHQSMNRAAAGAGAGAAGAGRQFTGRSGERLRLKALDEFRALRADVAEKRDGPTNTTDKAAGGGREESGLRVMRRVNSVSYTVADARREVHHG